MADFSAVIRNALAKVDATDPAARQVIYDKARASITRKIESLPKKPPQAVIDAQFEKLDKAIEEIEADHVPADDLADIASADEVAEYNPSGVEPAVDEPVELPVEPEPVVVEPSVDPLAEVEASSDDVSEPVMDAGAYDELIAGDDRAIPDIDVPDEMPDDAGPLADERDPLLDIIDDTGIPDRAPLPDAAFPDVNERFDAGADDAVERAIAAVPEVEERAFDSVAATDSTYGGEPEKPGARWGLLGAIAALAIVIGGVGYAAYANQDVLKSLFASASQEALLEDESGLPVRTVPSTVVEPDSGGDAAAETETGAEPAVEAATEQDGVNKFTQRLTADGVEVDDGPLEGTPQLGEGSSVSTQSEGLGTERAISDAQQAPDAAQGDPAVAPLPVGQRALFYEERTGSQAGTSFPGAAIWSVVQEEPGVGLPPEPAIRVESSVPDLGLVLELVIKRNGDTTLPASHIAELFFRVPDTFEGRGIADVQRLTLKASEGDPGNALIAVPAPIDTNIFLIAFNNADTAVSSNTTLLKEREWIDIPMQYISGRRALITLEKGSAGRDVFDEVFAYWEANPL